MERDGGAIQEGGSETREGKCCQKNEYTRLGQEKYDY